MAIESSDDFRWTAVECWKEVILLCSFLSRICSYSLRNTICPILPKLIEPDGLVSVNQRLPSDPLAIAIRRVITVELSAGKMGNSVILPVGAAKVFFVGVALVVPVEFVLPPLPQAVRRRRRSQSVPIRTNLWATW